MRNLGTATACILVALASPLASLAEGPPPSASPTPIEALLVEFADKPAEHAALANYYRSKASEARASAATHREMGHHYGTGKLLDRDKMKAHCEALAADFDKVAAEYDALAAMHDAQAKP